MTRTVGIDVGGSFLKTAVLDGDRLEETSTVPIPAGDLAGWVVAAARQALTRHRADRLGVSLAGLVRWPAGELVWGPHLAGREVPYRSLLESELGLPVRVDNDANAAAFAEVRIGAARGVRHAIVVSLGTGIGAGVVVDGDVYRGRSFAGEVGHMRIDPGGAECACGLTGCWETVVSGGSLDAAAVRLAAAGGAVAGMAGEDPPSARHIVAAATAGDPAAGRVVAEVGRWLGRGLAALVLVLDPEIVVVGGAVAAAGEALLAPAREAIASTLSGAPVRAPVPVIASTLGAHAGAIGAALLARRGEIDQPEAHE